MFINLQFCLCPLTSEPGASILKRLHFSQWHFGHLCAYDTVNRPSREKKEILEFDYGIDFYYGNPLYFFFEMTISFSENHSNNSYLLDCFFPGCNSDSSVIPPTFLY